MSASTTRSTFPPARWWASSLSTLTGIPAFTALIIGMMILAGTTLRSLIPTKVSNPTRTPAAHAEIHRPMGMKFSSTSRNTITISGMTQPIAPM